MSALQLIRRFEVSRGVRAGAKARDRASHRDAGQALRGC